MPDSNRIPTFNLKAVVQETGLKPDTLRAWERRYGLPEPGRTSGGHRLYSQRDIDILKWLVARQEEGLTIKRAVELWHQLAGDGQDPLYAEGYSLHNGQLNQTISAPAGESLENLRQNWVSACMAFDEMRAEQTLSQAFALHPVETVCLELLQKSLAEIGQGWYQGDITVQQEHFASELTMRRLEALLAASPPPTRAERILVGCPSEEEHTFGPLLLTLLLRRRGWEVLFLGANVPASRMNATVAVVKPSLVILVAQQLPTAASLLEMSRGLQSANVPLAYGGLIFNRLPQLRSHIPGHFLGERIDQAVSQVARWLNSVNTLSSKVTVEPGPVSYRQVLAHYLERQGAMEADVWQALRATALLPDYLANANKHLSRNIVAALTLGDFSLLVPEITWVKEMLIHYGLPADLLSRYLEVYHQAAQTHLDEPGQPLVDWLAQLSEQQE